MTYVNHGPLDGEPLISGRAYDKINHSFEQLRRRVGGAKQIEAQVPSAAPRLKPLEERLRFVQDAISDISMHLPKGFAAGLNRQFANLMDDDAWEDDDELISPEALTAFIRTLLSSQTNRRPGIGTNGRGSITASWTDGDSRLTIECLATGLVSLVLSRKGENGEVERAAFGPVRPKRVREILAPFSSEIWFGS